uniref:Uncharacterized protein n=1 Tax=Terrapene triunguis TaxID=2587831 RepID=A0A674JQ85_9SAUR
QDSVAAIGLRTVLLSVMRCKGHISVGDGGWWILYLYHWMELMLGAGCAVTTVGPDRFQLEYLLSACGATMEVRTETSERLGMWVGVNLSSSGDTQTDLKWEVTGLELLELEAVPRVPHVLSMPLWEGTLHCPHLENDRLAAFHGGEGSCGLVFTCDEMLRWKVPL